MDQVEMTSVLQIKPQIKPQLHKSHCSLKTLENSGVCAYLLSCWLAVSWLWSRHSQTKDLGSLSQSISFARGTENFGEKQTEGVLYLNMAQTAKLRRIAKHHRCTVAPFLSHSDANSISLSQQTDHKQLKLRFQNHWIPVAKTNMALWLRKPF